MLTVVMYHYIRDVAGTRWEQMRVRSSGEFRRQLDFIAAQHSVVRMEQVFEALSGGSRLPENAALLTFDDGLREHYRTVFPELRRRGWQGSFFPVVSAVRDRAPLAAHKIHALLATADATELASRVCERVRELGSESDVCDLESWYRSLAVANRFDSAPTIFVKRALQSATPAISNRSSAGLNSECGVRNQQSPAREENATIVIEPDWRAALLDELFAEYIEIPAARWTDELYLTIDDLRDMAAGGMHIGGHSVTHPWLNACSRERQEAEIRENREFLGEIGVIAQEGRWSMAYPYGGFDEATLQLAASAGVSAAFTTRVGVANLATDSPLQLPRLDTNDLPH